jgi:hypothetical protein
VKPPQELCPDRQLPAALCRIASRALSASPADRYPSIALLKQDLERFMCSMCPLGSQPELRKSAPAVAGVVREVARELETHVAIAAPSAHARQAH